MLFFIPFMIVITSFLFVIKRNNKSIIYLVILFVAFTVDILSLMLYLGKDNYYYNIILKYFGISRNTWNYFILAPFSHNWIIRTINISSVVFILTNLDFAVSFFPRMAVKWKRLKIWVFMPLILQAFIYDPSLYKTIYIMVYPKYVSFYAIDQFYAIASLIKYIINSGYLLASFILLVTSYIRIRSVSMIRHYMFFIMVSHISIMVNYCFLLLWAPTLLIKYSKIANYTDYKSLYLGENVLLYHIFPFFLMISMALITFSIIRYTSYQQRISFENSNISKEIDGANIASKVFSHYIKNEMLTIMAQIENIQMKHPESNELNSSMQPVIDRCQNVLTHLNTIHALTENPRMYLHPLSLDIPIQNALSELSDSTQDFKINLEIPSPCPTAQIDSDYFTQVLICILTNDMEAMAEVPSERRMLSVSVEEQSFWVILSIKDNGTGIAPQYIKKIFTPYFSTKPTSKNWGIGLSLCHKIITAHGGKITVDSEPGEGTTFKILLPVISDKIFQLRLPLLKSKKQVPQAR